MQLCSYMGSLGLWMMQHEEVQELQFVEGVQRFDVQAVVLEKGGQRGRNYAMVLKFSTAVAAGEELQKIK